MLASFCMSLTCVLKEFFTLTCSVMIQLVHFLLISTDTAFPEFSSFCSQENIVGNKCLTVLKESSEVGGVLCCRCVFLFRYI